METCWTRAYDFTLSNVDDFELSTPVAQIVQGESLYGLFRAGAWRDNSMTPTNFQATIEFEGQVVYSNSFQTLSQDVQEESVDLTSNISGLPPGNYVVTLTTVPDAVGCTIEEPVIQSQQLTIMAPQTYEVEFVVRDFKFN